MRKPLAHLSPFEWLIALTLIVLAVVSGTAIVYKANNDILTEVPRSGGRHIEGITGTPNFINPLLAISAADKDLTTMVYAGLMTRNNESVLIPELAEAYTLSDDGTTYTFTLRPNLTFHDGTPLTSTDVAFTAKQAANQAIRSPVFAHWEGITVAVVDEQTITFTLPEPYAPFLENTTLGILPKHIWSGLAPDQFPFSHFNIAPVGAGPYQVREVARDKSGIPESYELSAFDSYVLGTPHIQSFAFRLYNGVADMLDAFAKGEVDAVHGVSPALLEDLLKNTENSTQVSILRAPLLRTFALFFNHNKQPLFLRDEVREALDTATPKQAVVGEILRGYGTVLNGPIPPHIIERLETEVVDTGEEADEEATKDDEVENDDTEAINRIEQAREILEDAGWEKNEETDIYELEKKEEMLRLSVTLTTVNMPELVQAAERIKESWQEVGAEVEIKVSDPTDLTQSVIRPRRYEVLLFGMVIGHELDLYAFWHSSQRNDPGLNIAQFADIEADALLEQARTERDHAERARAFLAFEEIIKEQYAVTFLYTPDFVYLVRKGTHNVMLHPIAEPHDRLSSVHTWYIETDRVWPFLKSFVD